MRSEVSIFPFIPVRLVKEDAEALSALERLCFSSPWKLEQLRNALELPHFIAYGIKYQDELLAYISLAHILDELEVLNLATHPSSRRKGLARCLITYVLKSMQNLGAKQITLEVRTGNIPARNLYASVGMIQVGIRKHYYTDTGEDALILKKETADFEADI